MSKPAITIQSPGRINLIGEHTDYNEGFVLPAAIDKKTIFQIHKNGDPQKVSIRAVNKGDSFSFDLRSFQPIPNGWPNYVMGVVHELQQLGTTITGFDGQFESTVPIGSGMSSSAALECSLAFGLNELFDLGLDTWQLIKVCQLAEHHFVGTQCGIMDQFASMMGKKDQLLLLDCRSLNYQYIPFESSKYELLLLNTNVTHQLVNSAYNDRRAACEEGVRILQSYLPDVKSLRDASLELLDQFKQEFTSPILKRCQHVVTENERVWYAAKALQAKDFKRLGQLMYQSHLSLQFAYEVSCSELDELVVLTMDKPYILGSRMMGGGFGGCTINLIEKKKVAQFIEQAAEKYKARFGIELTPYQISIEAGTSIV